jgi:hypothetical protein
MNQTTSTFVSGYLACSQSYPPMEFWRRGHHPLVRVLSVLRSLRGSVMSKRDRKAHGHAEDLDHVPIVPTEPLAAAPGPVCVRANADDIPPGSSGSRTCTRTFVTRSSCCRGCPWARSAFHKPGHVSRGPRPTFIGRGTCIAGVYIYATENR